MRIGHVTVDWDPERVKRERLERLGRAWWPPVEYYRAPRHKRMLEEIRWVLTVGPVVVLRWENDAEEA